MRGIFELLELRGAVAEYVEMKRITRAAGRGDDIHAYPTRRRSVRSQPSPASYEVGALSLLRPSWSYMAAVMVSIACVAPKLEGLSDSSGTYGSDSTGSGSVDGGDADGDGFSAAEGDCNDGDSNISPSASDVVGDSIDQNCDGVDGTDSDSDGFASVASGGRDCDDADSNINPSADELCDSGGVDENCDGLANNDDPSSQADASTLYYADDDLDGFGDSAQFRGWCDPPGDGWTTTAGDCDDSKGSVYPGAPEECDGVDGDCDGTVDEGDVCECAREEYLSSVVLVCDERLSWVSAKVHCESIGYRMLMVADESQQEWFERIVAAEYGPDTSWWLGATDAESEGTWVSSSGEELLYFNWADGQPSDDAGRLNCMLTSAHRGWSWSDENCDGSWRFACEL